jgi:DNA-directed RNA polymerase subunit M/transcription elongation factor TFIIS
LQSIGKAGIKNSIRIFARSHVIDRNRARNQIWTPGSEKAKVDDMLAAGRKERSAGFIKCSKCKSAEVDVEQKQTRSADEPMTLFAL